MWPVFRVWRSFDSGIVFDSVPVVLVAICWEAAAVRKIVSLCSIVCLLAAIGCSGDAGQTIEGKVTFSDGSPLGLGALVLSNGKNSYSGAINSDGTYKIDKVISGDYNVGISGAVIGGTKSTEFQMDYDADGNFVEHPEAQPAVPLIKESMSNPETSNLTLKVPGKYDLTVEKP